MNFGRRRKIFGTYLGLLAVLLGAFSELTFSPRAVQAEEVKVVDVVATDSSYVVMSDGTVWEWKASHFEKLDFLTEVKKFVAYDWDDYDGKTFYVLKNDGTVWAWGKNTYGQFGDGTTIDSQVPVKVKGLSNVSDIEVGKNFVVALKKDGTVWVWGENLYGQLGIDSEQLSIKLPVQCKALNGIVAISAGKDNAFAVKDDGTTWRWGKTDYGQVDRAPVQILFGIEVKDVSASVNFALFLSVEGGVYGVKKDGRTSTPSGYGPQDDLAGIETLDDIVYIKAGEYNPATSFAIKSDGTLWSWGSNLGGKLGVAQGSDPKPALVPNITKVKKVSVGFNHILAMTEEGEVYSWGVNINGELGNNSSRNEGLFGPAKSLIGLGPTKMPDTPVSSSVSAGYMHALAVSTKGVVWAWGDNEYGQLGNGSSVKKSEKPVFIKELTGATSVSAGGGHSLAIKDGAVWAWGDNSAGQIGDGSTTNKSMPQKINLADLKQVAAGVDYSLALKKDGTVWAWGSNEYGTLGDGTFINRNKPVRVPGLTDVVQISAGSAFALAVKSDGTVWTWGAKVVMDFTPDESADPVDKATIDTTPQKINELSNIVKVSAGYSHSLALKSDGTVWAWGGNAMSQLGNNSDIDSLKPVKVENLQNIISVSAGMYGSGAIDKYGNAWSWGGNVYGQLGSGYSADKLGIAAGPTKVTKIDNAQTMAFGVGFALAKDRKGKIFGWGSDNEGQLGIDSEIVVDKNQNVKGALAPTLSEVVLGDNLPVNLYRSEGESRNLTAVEVSKRGWAQGADTVVLAKDSDFPDALAGAPLAHYFNSPILLTNNKALTPETKIEIERLKPTKIVILGSFGAVSEEIEKSLKSKYQVIRLGGIDRFDTSAKIAEYLYAQNSVFSGEAVIANGYNFPDALTISSWAAKNNVPILLAGKEELPQRTDEALKKLKVTETIISGGTGVISEKTAAKLPGVKRYAGMNRYGTGVTIAKSLNTNIRQIFVATGSNFPDALAGSVLAARTGATILLVDKNLEEASITSFLSENSGFVESIMILGGYGVVSWETMCEIRDLVQ